jgi:protein-disulfide isomerase
MSQRLRGMALIWALAVVVALGAAAAARAAEPPLRDLVLGNADAKIEVVEYASLTCPHCAAFNQDTLPKIKAEYIDSGKVKLVFRDFPLDGLALRAHMLARCAGAERFYGFIDVLFRQQKQWATASDPMVELKRIGKFGGVSDAQFDACMADKKLEDYVLQSRFEGQNKFKVNSTPTLIVGDKVQSGAPSYDDFKKMLDAAIKG